MILYRYLTGPDDQTFCHRVTAALNNGWLLYGPAAMTYDAEQKRVVCGQAITKEVPDQKYDPEMELASF
jgi:hypothetical protein